MNLPDRLFKKSTLSTEKIFDRFVESVKGERLSLSLPKNPSFKNADYRFKNDNVIAELKTIQTDFGKTDSFRNKHIELVMKYLSENRMTLSALFDNREKPPEFIKDFLYLFRRALSRIIEKANKQIKETKKELDLGSSSGVLLLINDNFLSLEPQFIIKIICEILTHSYSSIDAFVYLTLNHYVDIPNDDYARLLWIPFYSEKASDTLVCFVDNLGSKWFKFLEKEGGKFDSKIVTDDRRLISQAKAISRDFEQNW